MDKIVNITSTQLMTLLLSAQVGIGIVMLPSLIAQKAGHDGWICMLVGSVFASLSLFLILKLLQRYKNKSIYEITHLLYGKFLGTVLNIAIILYLIITASMTLRLFVNFVRVTVLPNTPPLVITFFILLPSTYVVRYGLISLSRINSNTYVTSALTVLFLLATRKNLHFSFLLPIGESGILPILQGSLSAFFAFLGLELVTIFYPHVSDKDKVMKFCFLANTMSSLFFFVIVLFTTSLFGENLLKNLLLPVFTLAGTINAPVLERVDLYFAVIWFMAAGSSMRMFLFSGYHSICQVLHFAKSKKLLASYVIAVALLSRIPKDNNGLLTYLNITGYLGIGVIIFLIICLLLSFILKKGVVKQ